MQHLPPPDDDALAHSARLREVIQGQIIAAGGSMPFWKFMELALYAPGLGYYSAGATKFGGAGDFVTAPELGPLYAECVAEAVAPVIRQIGEDARVLEIGAGSGRFAEYAIKRLMWLDAMPARYAILEPSADLRARQQAHLRQRLTPPVFERVEWLDGPMPDDWNGVLFANEVIDALPTPRFTIRDGEVFEEYVALDDERRFVRSDRPADALLSSAVRHVERQLEAPFADGYRSELLPHLPYWLQAVSGGLRAGAMLFVDYGHPRREYYDPRRRDGTLRAFYRHQVVDDVFARVGLQDITASVDFTALAEAGNSAGFGVAAYLSQAQFLIGAGLQEVFGQMQPPDEHGRYRLSQQVRKLMLPDQMGERFQAMLLARGLDALPLPAELLAADQGSRL